MKIRRTILAIVMCGSTIGLFAQPASAGQPIAGCTDSFTLVKANKHPEGASVDKNGDGWVCEKPLPGTGNEGFFNVVDNTKT